MVNASEGEILTTLFRSMPRKDPNAQQKNEDGFISSVVSNAGNAAAGEVIKHINGETVDALTGGLKRLGTAGRVSAAAIKFAAEAIQDGFLDESRELIQDNEGTTVGELIKDLAEGSVEGLVLGGAAAVVGGPVGVVTGGLALGFGALSGWAKDRLSQGGPAAVIEQYLESEREIERLNNWGASLRRELEQQERDRVARFGKSRMTRRPAITGRQTEDSQREELDLEQEAPRASRRTRINRRPRRTAEVTVEETINNQQSEAQQQGNTELQEELFRQNQERQDDINQEQSQRNESIARTHERQERPERPGGPERDQAIPEGPENGSTNRGHGQTECVMTVATGNERVSTFEREFDSEGNPTGRYKHTVKRSVKDGDSSDFEEESEEMISDGDHDNDCIPNSKDSDYVPPKEESTEPKEQEKPDPEGPGEDEDDWDEEKRPNPANEDQGDAHSNANNPLKDIDADIDWDPENDGNSDPVTGYEGLEGWSGRIDPRPLDELSGRDGGTRFDYLIDFDGTIDDGPDGRPNQDRDQEVIYGWLEDIDPRTIAGSIQSPMAAGNLSVAGVNLNLDDQELSLAVATGDI